MGSADMVTTAHNRQLGVRDVFPGVLWTEEYWHRKMDQFQQARRQRGQDEQEVYFGAAQDMEEYQQSMPNLRARQQAMKKIYPNVSTGAAAWLTWEQLEYLQFLLEGTQNEVGLEIKRKVDKCLE